MSSDFIVWVCPVCGHSNVEPNPSTYAPITICGPHYDEMGLEYFVKMSKYVKAEEEKESDTRNNTD